VAGRSMIITPPPAIRSTTVAKGSVGASEFVRRPAPGSPPPHEAIRQGGSSTCA
jgi:hypothetical protein